MSQAQQSTTPPRSTHASYHPGGYGVSEGLKRARRPYFWKNAATGGAILGFATAVYYYSISKVKQDDFSDLANLTASNSNNTQASSSLSSALSSTTDRIHSAASTASTQASHKLDALASNTHSSLSRLAEQAQHASTQAREQVREAGHEAGDVFRTGRDAVEPKDDVRNRLRELILLAQGRPL
ncbi:unnamed protein product [Tilletia controversa]|uniref:Cytochrome c oxidase assembly factor 3 n=1 Tax=Tilletia controversa TaxID=13291 RepID=A0A8X7SZW0_9BASI|nr:hypothetical protein A4X06_0g1687 [Tilletia controversa]CAD6924709.1 unnamed protein product [Tilletia controversa]CAD6945564.1 unnamed protein product [Tilletia controversa]CAD6980483.1 unnamed protein product [Tilletia controversa]